MRLALILLATWLLTMAMVGAVIVWPHKLKAMEHEEIVNRLALGLPLKATAREHRRVRRERRQAR